MKASRVNFANIYSKYQKLGKSNVRLTQSSLFLTKQITGVQTAYTFDVLENQNQNPEEIRLNINDEFIVTELGIYLYGTITSGEAGASVRNIMVTNTLRQLDAANGNNVSPVYDGKLKIAVNNVVYMEKWDSKKHEIVPFDQFTYDAAGVTNAVSKQDGSRFETDGMFELAPMVTLSGAKKNELTLECYNAPLAGSFPWVDQSGNTAVIKLEKIALFLRGLNAQNAARFQ